MESVVLFSYVRAHSRTTRTQIFTLICYVLQLIASWSRKTNKKNHEKS